MKRSLLVAACLASGALGALLLAGFFLLRDPRIPTPGGEVDSEGPVSEVQAPPRESARSELVSEKDRVGQSKAASRDGSRVADLTPAAAPTSGARVPGKPGRTREGTTPAGPTTSVEKKGSQARSGPGPRSSPGSRQDQSPTPALLDEWSGILVKEALNDQPIAGAEVRLFETRLFPVTDTDLLPPAPASPLVEGRTSQDGTWFIEGPERPCSLEVMAEGYALTRVNGVKTRPGFTVWLQGKSELDTAGDLVTVLDAGGALWPGIEVEAVEPGALTGGAPDFQNPLRVAKARTDSQGQCRFANASLSARRYRVPAAGESWTSPWIDPSRGEQQLTLGPLPALCRVSVRIVDSAGVPRAGYPLTIRGRRRAVWKNDWGIQNLGLQTGADGTASAEGLVAGTYDVQFGRDPQWSALCFQSYQEVLPPAASLHTGEPLSIELKEGEPSTAQWVAGEAVIRGRVVAPAGVWPGRGTIRVSGRRACTVLSGENGVFEVRQAAIGKYLMVARDFRSYDSKPVQVTVLQGQSAVDVEIPLLPHGLLPVAVEGPGGGPIPGARVAWLDADRPVFMPKQFRGARRLEFEGFLPQGSQTIFAHAPGWRIIQKTIQVARGTNQTLVITFSKPDRL